MPQIVLGPAQCGDVLGHLDHRIRLARPSAMQHPLAGGHQFGAVLAAVRHLAFPAAVALEGRLDFRERAREPGLEQVVPVPPPARPPDAIRRAAPRRHPRR